MEAKIIMGNKIAVVTNDRDEFGDPHKTEHIISYDAAIKLMMELGHCVDIVQEKPTIHPLICQCDPAAVGYFTTMAGKVCIGCNKFREA